MDSDASLQSTASDEDVLARLQPLLDRSVIVQEELLTFRTQYTKYAGDAPLPPGVLHAVRKGTRRYLDLQETLGAIVQRLRNRAGRTPEPPGPVPDLTLALAAAVALYDNYLAILPLLADKRYRRVVNHVDLGYGIQRDELWHVVEKLNDRGSRRRLRQLLAAWEAGPGRHAPPAGRVDTGLHETIRSSVTWYLAQSGTLAQTLPSPALNRRRRILDGLAWLGNEALYVVSEGFGNAIGAVELRKGKLWQREDVLGHLHRVLRPLDLLLEKTPFRLTDLLIPGHFGHVAIWMGRPRKLQRLGVWKHEDMREPRYQACRPLIEEGRGVLEALRSGVELNPLRVFANVDDLLIIRPHRRGRRKTVEGLVRGFRQIGKEYDFGFDVETTDTIVCSELPYHVFPDVDWDTEAQMGRFTISPDDIARQALGPKPDFQPIAFYHDGALVPGKQAREKLESLVMGAS